MPLRLLIVEDSPLIARVQSHIGRKLGYTVDIAPTLKQAKNLIASNQYFCAVVDYTLPDAPYGEGIPVITEAGIATIVMTGRLDLETRRTVEKYPLVDYITKENKQAYLYLENQLKNLPRNLNVNILVVDDSDTMRKHIVSLLNRHKFNTIEATNGWDAYQQIEKNPAISVVITDHEMPVMKGDELCAKIRNKYRNDEMIIIGISQVDAHYLSSRFLKNGANDYLCKPFIAEEFYCRISQNLDMLENVAKIRQQANTDYLTELPNRRFFFEQGRNKIQLAEQNKQNVCLAIVDVDHFKKVNDTHGHDAGDLVLKSLAERLKQHFAQDLVARLGGEEFVIYIENKSTASVIGRLDLIRSEIEQQSAAFNSLGVCYTLSIGLAASNYHLETLLKQADMRLYKAKQSGRNNLVYND
ncbi:response regulator [Gayadomonas joobiniege]|uniref:GGDEF domain-containing response regulator n=1 Tax=Gayadomonas joobiniege TaxID=1234606 RepID=UPI00036D8C70|nr:response regulator [Gayadomonas joobiniege]